MLTIYRVFEHGCPMFGRIWLSWPENGSLFHVLEYPSQNDPYNDSWNVKMIR